MAVQTTTYSKMPRSIAEYTMMRGVTDFSNASQFNLYESGYQHLCVLSKPKYMEKLATPGSYAERLLNTFCYALEYEFKGLDGIDDITVDNIEFTDGISSLNTIGKVNMQSSAEITMQFTEKSGTCLTKFVDYYIRGVKDPRTQVKTYHGLIENGILAGGFENEVFTFLYIVTDNTMLALEKAYLFVNAFPSKAPTAIFNGTKGEIDKKEIDLPFQCFVIDGEEVNKRASKMLAYINKKDAVKNVSNPSLGVYSDEAAGAVKEVTNTIAPVYKNGKLVEGPITLDSNDFAWAGLDSIDKAIK